MESPLSRLRLATYEENKGVDKGPADLAKGQKTGLLALGTYNSQAFQGQRAWLITWRKASATVSTSSSVEARPREKRISELAAFFSMPIANRT